MGWGMPFERFSEMCLIKHDGGAYHALDEVFGQLEDADLTVDDKLYRSLFYGEGRKPRPILQKRLLATRYDANGQEPSPAGLGTDLYTTVTTPDETTDIIFFPNLRYRKKWCRWDDDLDYVFEQYRDGIDSEPRDFTVYGSFGHYPWTNELSDLDGNPIPWEDHTALANRTDWMPAVPTEIRWYLTQHGILFNDGVNQLRPVVAQWWS